MAAEETTTGQTGGQSGSIWKRKYGPLPLWAWGLIVLAVVGAWRLYSEHKAGTSTQQQDQTTAADQAPPYVFQNYLTIDTPDHMPPGAGREHPPVPPPVPGPAPSPTPAPPAVGGGPAVIPAPKPPPTPTPAPASPSGTWVTVAKYTNANPAWNSTLWGIAKHFGYGSASNNWAAIWSAPQNASLVARRKQATSIQPNDQIFVPAK